MHTSAQVERRMFHDTLNRMYNIPIINHLTLDRNPRAAACPCACARRRHRRLVGRPTGAGRVDDSQSPAAAEPVCGDGATRRTRSGSDRTVHAYVAPSNAQHMHRHRHSHFLPRWERDGQYDEGGNGKATSKPPQWQRPKGRFTDGPLGGGGYSRGPGSRVASFPPPTRRKGQSSCHCCVSYTYGCHLVVDGGIPRQSTQGHGD
ncbi:hypothetical protein LZ30DRAFT_109740 [Colletotrichum cereale]|nr:hypothetical protein LZ30DRAFT_109740 [Colletotrichum cereale]